jgi:hypothetical protein
MKNSTIFFLIVSTCTIIGTIAVDLHLLIYETNIAQSTILEEQVANIPGISSMAVGHGTRFEGFGSKYEAVIPALRKMDEDMLVVMSDSRDVLVNHPWIRDNSLGGNDIGQEFLEAFNTLTAPFPGAVVASAESQCCVGALTFAVPGDYFTEDSHRNRRACYSGRAPCLWNGDDKVIPWENFMTDLAYSRVATGKDIFLNAGLIAGKAGDMLRLFERADFEVHEDDQAVLTDFMYRHPNELILDYNQVLFGNNRHEANGCVFQDETNDKRLIHRETGATPLFIHSPGGYISCHESLASLLGVELRSSVDERRLLQDWKRDLQNYGPPTKAPAGSDATRAPVPIPVPVNPPVPAPIPRLFFYPVNRPTINKITENIRNIPGIQMLLENAPCRGIRKRKGLCS